MASQVEHSHYSGFVLSLQVVNAEGKPAGQHPETAMLLPMDSMIERQAFDVVQQRITTVLAHTGLLGIAKRLCGLQVPRPPPPGRPPASWRWLL
jgi:hypothetical protein